MSLFWMIQIINISQILNTGWIWFLSLADFAYTFCASRINPAPPKIQCWNHNCQICQSGSLWAIAGKEPSEDLQGASDMLADDNSCLMEHYDYGWIWLTMIDYNLLWFIRIYYGQLWAGWLTMGPTLIRCDNSCFYMVHNETGHGCIFVRQPPW
jgi:hypothetical protein